MAIKLNDGTFGQGMQWLHDILYDRLRLLVGNPLQTALFRNKAGDNRNSVVLTLADTNNQSSQVPTGQKWYFWMLTVKYQAAAARTDAQIQLILNFFRNTQITLNILNLDKMFSMPLSHFMPGDQLVSAPAATINSQYPKGSSKEDWELKVPIVLQEQANWTLDINQLAASDTALDNDFVLFEFDREMFRAG